MKELLEKSVYLTLIAVLASLVAAVAAYATGVIRTVTMVGELLAGTKTTTAAIVSFIEIADIFLIATTLLIFGIAIYELFIGELNLPDWLVVHNFTELKDRLASVIVLVMAVSFLKFLLDGKNPTQDILQYGLAVGAIIVALGIFERLGHAADADSKPH
jgi:uncharacterized membrane protein YqhA